MASSDIRYLVFDIETVADGRLIQKIKYPDTPELTPKQAVDKYRQELLEVGTSDFIPYTFVLPVSVAIAKIGWDMTLKDVVTLDRPQFRPQVITRHFWDGWKKYGKPTFVTFNGRTFDIPVMEMSAYRFGINIAEWFDMSGPNYKQPRYRYTLSNHLDLLELLGNFGTSRITGGLNLCATLLGKPGKMDTKGSMVQDLWDEGKTLEIDNYCMCDALDTYFVFLRTRVLAGEISLEQEQDIVHQAHDWIEEKSAQNPALEKYLEHFEYWKNPTDEDDVFSM